MNYILGLFLFQNNFYLKNKYSLAWDQIQNVSSFDNLDRKTDPGMALDVRLHFEYVEPEQKFPDCEYGAYRRTLLLPFWASSVKGENNNKRMWMKSINLFFLLINQHIVVLTTRTSEVWGILFFFG